MMQAGPSYDAGGSIIRCRWNCHAVPCRCLQREESYELFESKMRNIYRQRDVTARQKVAEGREQQAEYRRQTSHLQGCCEGHVINCGRRCVLRE